MDFFSSFDTSIAANRVNQSKMYLSNTLAEHFVIFFFSGTFCSELASPIVNSFSV